MLLCYRCGEYPQVYGSGADGRLGRQSHGIYSLYVYLLIYIYFAYLCILSVWIYIYSVYCLFILHIYMHKFHAYFYPIPLYTCELRLVRR